MNFKYILLFIFSFLMTQSFAQVEEAMDASMDEAMGMVDSIKTEKSTKRFKFDFGTTNIGISSYISEGSGFDMPDSISYMDQNFWRSGNWIIHLADLKVGLNANGAPQKLTFNTGVRINWSYYGFKDEFTLIKDQETFRAALTPVTKEVRKHRLLGTYIQIPVGFEFTTNPEDPATSWNIGLAYSHNFLLGANHRIKYDDKEKVRTRDDFNLNPSYGMIELKIGRGDFNFYVQYGIDSLFVQDKGPNVIPFNFGIVSN